MSELKVGLIGVGMMGKPMARRLMAAGRGFKDRPWDELLRLWEEFIGKPIRM